jgi:hypothetical protein
MATIGPFTLVTVNTAPDRAKRLIGRVVEDVKEQYTIIHAANAASIDEVRETVEEARPDILVSTVPPTTPFGSQGWSMDGIETETA